MSAQTEALDRLIEAVEAGTAGDYSVFRRGPCLWRDALPDAVMCAHASASFNGSLDAAKALHEALLPGTSPGLSRNIHTGFWFAWVQDKVQWHFSATDRDPARAWLLAILRAYRGTLA